VTDKIQPGGRIDPDVWERFKKHVEKKTGRKRGVLGEELEKAIEMYLSGTNATEPIHRIENDIATTKAQLARIEDQLSDADGGRTMPEPGVPRTPSNDDSTHTDTDDRSDGGTDDKPHPKATIDEKVEWLICEVFDDRESGAYVRADLIDRVEKEYSLSEDAVERMADAMLTKVGAKDTPQDNDLLAWGDLLHSFKEQAREDAREEAERDFDAIDDAERDGR
jgi:hypothetical protein